MWGKETNQRTYISFTRNCRTCDFQQLFWYYTQWFDPFLIPKIMISAALRYWYTCCFTCKHKQTERLFPFCKHAHEQYLPIICTHTHSSMHIQQQSIQYLYGAHYTARLHVGGVFSLLVRWCVKPSVCITEDLYMWDTSKWNWTCLSSLKTFTFHPRGSFCSSALKKSLGWELNVLKNFKRDQLSTLCHNHDLQ